MPETPRPIQPRPRLNRRKPDVATVAAGLPSFIRRAKRLERTIERLKARMQRERSKLIPPISREVRRLRALDGEAAAARFVPAADFASVARAAAAADPEYATRYLAPLPTGDAARQRLAKRAASKLVDHLLRFRARWVRLLESIDLDDINAQVDSYNRWYLVEVEAAGMPIKHVDTSPREPWTTERLASLVEPLAQLELAS